jgi:hypothetical protein
VIQGLRVANQSCAFSIDRVVSKRRSSSLKLCSSNISAASINSVQNLNMPSTSPRSGSPLRFEMLYSSIAGSANLSISASKVCQPHVP